MKYNIEKRNTGLEVEVWDAAECRAEVLEAFRKCQEGRCICPVAEHQKLDELSLECDTDRIALRLTAKAGQDLDDQAIKECLACTLGAASKAKRSAK